ncbi:MAG: hypothetical protein EOP83_14810 [Verrucomicrobiaceae bacterium]|nr:MAG: hypothetical protein EOP83_14810 [Verrucomicrobiaceae bacterium]
MSFFQIKDHDPGDCPQVMAEFVPGEEALEQEWLDWLKQHECPHGSPWKGLDGDRSYFVWMPDPDIFFAYKMRWGRSREEERRDD